ncbi:MAG: nucleotidyltransferase family protein [Candidatus Aenigmatarchaeota archaeon]
MEAVILAGGFAKRLWPLTKETPKPLLEVGGKPILEHVLGKILALEEVGRVRISINKKFEPKFQEWLSAFPERARIELLVEPSLSEEEKFGSIAAWQYLIEQKGIKDDLMSVSGDNIFGFDLGRLLEFYREKRAVTFALSDVGDLELAKKYGIVQLDETGKVVGFEEKPEQPKSTLASTGVYIFPKEALGLIKEYLDQGGRPDQPGRFLAWLHKRQPVYGMVFREKWFDIGSLEELERARREIR